MENNNPNIKYTLKDFVRQYSNREDLSYQSKFIQTNYPGTGYYTRYRDGNNGTFPVDLFGEAKTQASMRIDYLNSQLPDKFADMIGKLSQKLLFVLFVVFLVLSIFSGNNVFLVISAFFFVVYLIIFVARKIRNRKFIDIELEIKQLKDSYTDLKNDVEQYSHYIPEAQQALQRADDETVKAILSNFINCLTPGFSPDNILDMDSSMEALQRKYYESILSAFEPAMRCRLLNSTELCEDNIYGNYHKISLYVGVFNFLKSQYDIPVIDFGSAQYYFYPSFLIRARSAYSFDVVPYHECSVCYSDFLMPSTDLYSDSVQDGTDEHGNPIYKMTLMTFKFGTEELSIILSNVEAAENLVNAFYSYFTAFQGPMSYTTETNQFSDMKTFLESLYDDFNLSAKVVDINFPNFEDWDNFDYKLRLRYLAVADFCIQFERMGHPLRLSVFEGSFLSDLIKGLIDKDVESQIPVVGKICNLLKQSGRSIYLSDLMMASGIADFQIKLYQQILLGLLRKVAIADLDIDNKELEVLNFVDGYYGISAGEDSKNQKTAQELLDELIGMDSVKEQVKQLHNLLKIQKLRIEKGLPVSEPSYHLVFTGNPGTGKTTVARIVAQIYRELGVLDKCHLVETERNGLVAQYVGQTAAKTSAVLDSAMGGVLFIDEAYSLYNGAREDFGPEAINTILKRMEDCRDQFAVIIAGYPKEMENLLDSNPGLRSRFNRYINFPDYTADELVEIFKYMLSKYGYIATTEALECLRSHFECTIKTKDRNFGNARLVRNIFEKTIEKQSTRLAEDLELSDEKLSEIIAGDLAIDNGKLPAPGKAVGFSI